MKQTKILTLTVILAMLLSGCGVGRTQTPEAYQDIFTGGSFDKNMVWTTDDESYSDLINLLSAKCESTFEGSLLVATDDNVIYAGGFNATETDGKSRVN